MPTIDGLVNGSALDGTERVPVWQGGDAKDVPASFFKDYIAGWEHLGSQTLGADAASISLTPLTAKAHLQVIIDLVGFATTDRPALRFNNDTGTNYMNRALAFASGATTATNVEDVSTTRMALTGVNSTNARSFRLDIPNRAATIKDANISMGNAGTSAATASQIIQVAGAWFNTSAQITRVDLIGVSGNNLLAGTAMYVFGRDTA